MDSIIRSHVCDSASSLLLKQSIERSASVAASAAAASFGRRALGIRGQMRPDCCRRWSPADCVLCVSRRSRPMVPAPIIPTDRSPRIGRFACQTGVLRFSHHRRAHFPGPGIERSHHSASLIEGNMVECPGDYFITYFSPRCYTGGGLDCKPEVFFGVEGIGCRATVSVSSHYTNIPGMGFCEDLHETFGCFSPTMRRCQN